MPNKLGIKSGVPLPNLSSYEVAFIFNISPITVRKWIKNGILTGFNLPGSREVRIPAPEVRRLAQEMSIPYPPILDRCCTEHESFVSGKKA